MMSPSYYSYLPPELWREIVTLLPPISQKAFSLVSHSARNQALPSIFGSLSFSRHTKFAEIHNVSEDVKNTIRFVLVFFFGQSLQYKPIFSAAQKSEIDSIGGL